jgi:hypothetical protein
MAESSSSGGAPTTARLDFQITIPTILYLQVGSVGGTIDIVTFPNPGLPGTPVGASSGAVNVRAATLVPSGQAVRLEADSLAGLSDGSHTIPFTEISWAATGNFTGNTFSGAAGQLLDTFSGPGNRTGTYSFTYGNAGYYSPGAYTGRVTYTLSSP